MTTKDTKEKHDVNIENLKQQIEASVVANNEAICRELSGSKLSHKEISELTDEVVEYISNVKFKLEEIESSDDDIIEKINKTEDLQTEIHRRKDIGKAFFRDYGLVTKTITAKNYYSDSLIKNLCLLCDAYATEFKNEYDKKSNQQKFDVIKQHIKRVPVAFAQKTTSRYINVQKYIDTLSAKDSSFKKELSGLKRIINKVSNVRKAAFWFSAIPAICVFVWLSTIWGEQYSQNILVPLASIAIAITIYIIVFDIITYIYKKAVL